MTHRPSLVSVVLPFRDAADTIAAAIASLQLQTLGDFDCILIDNQSTDDSRSIATKTIGADRRFRIVAHAGSFVAALNAGCARAEAAFIARMDADDLAAPRRLEAQHAMLATDASLDVASCLVSAFPHTTVRDGMRRYVAWSNGLRSPAQILHSLFIESPLIHPSIMMRRSVFERAGGYRETDGPEDYDLWFRLLLCGARAAKVPAVLLHWRDSATRLTRTDPHYTADRIFEMKLRYLPRLLPRGTRVQICGAGPIGRRWGRALRRSGYPLCRFIDVDPQKQGRTIAGATVEAPHRLRRADGFIVSAVGVPGARAEIDTFLQARGLRPWFDYVAVA